MPEKPRKRALKAVATGPNTAPPAAKETTLNYAEQVDSERIGCREVIYRDPTHYDNNSNRAAGAEVEDISAYGVSVWYSPEQLIFIPWANIRNLRVHRLDPLAKKLGVQPYPNG